MRNTVNILNVMIEEELSSPFESIEGELVSHIPVLDAIKDTISNQITSKEHALSVIEEAQNALSIMAVALQRLKDTVILQE
jgi:hypothetical protein